MFETRMERLRALFTTFSIVLIVGGLIVALVPFGRPNYSPPSAATNTRDRDEADSNLAAAQQREYLELVGCHADAEQRRAELAANGSLTPKQRQLQEILIGSGEDTCSKQAHDRAARAQTSTRFRITPEEQRADQYRRDRRRYENNAATRDVWGFTLAGVGVVMLLLILAASWILGGRQEGADFQP